MSASSWTARTARGVAAAVVFAAGIALAGRIASGEAPREVVIDDFAFGPAALTVAAGTRVEWTNRDGEPHTVVSADTPARFKSDALDTGDRFAVVFDKPGTYKYFCSVHPQMTGAVVVK
jgi:plastocyanin